ncbi:MAG: hypothetical protein MRY74_15720 [Neomegalonema sp.]|nr:hypothetical protein [Neomegalonema sp.]
MRPATWITASAMVTALALSSSAFGQGGAVHDANRANGETRSPTADLGPRARLDIVTSYRQRLARQILLASHKDKAERRPALRVMTAKPRRTTAKSLIGAYRCSVYSTIWNYLGSPGVHLYRSGTFACVIDRTGGRLRFRKVSGEKLAVMLDEPTPGLFTFRSKYDSGLIRPVRSWFVESAGRRTVRIMPFENAMPAELADTGAPLTGAKVTFFVLTKR